MKENINTITELLLRLENFDASRYDESFLAKTLEKRIAETFCDSKEAYLAYLKQSHIEVLEFIDSLSVSYSEFFRNSLTFSVLEHIVLPAIIYKKEQNNQREIRIWSAACASGQESYSLAMLLNEYFSNEPVRFRVFATDQSEEQIERAKRGSYHISELSHLTISRLNEWFVKHGDTYTIKDILKEHIEFSAFNFFNEKHTSPPASIFGDFDLIMCANVLFYYKPEFRKKIINKIKSNLSIDGVIITGETEREIVLNQHFKEIYPQSAIFKLPVNG